MFLTAGRTSAKRRPLRCVQIIVIAAAATRNCWLLADSDLSLSNHSVSCAEAVGEEIGQESEVCVYSGLSLCVRVRPPRHGLLMVVIFRRV